MRRSGARILGLLVALLCSGPASGQDLFADCEARLEAEPRAAYRCFYLTGTRQQRLDEAARRLARLPGAEPDSPWRHFYLGNVDLLRGEPGADRHFHAAAARFTEVGDWLWVANSHLNLSNFFRQRERFADAERALGDAHRAAERVDDSELALRLRIASANLLYYQADFERAYRDLRTLEPELFPDGPIGLRLFFLQVLGLVSYELGEPGEALGTYRRLAELMAESGNPHGEASARYNVAIAELERWPEAGDRQQVLELLRLAYDKAHASHNEETEVRAAKVLGKMLEGAEGRRYLDRCLSLALERGLPREITYCLAALAVHQLADDPAAASRTMDRAIGRALDSVDTSEIPWALIYSWEDRLRVRWATWPRQRALADALAVLEVLDRLRDLQSSEASRAGLFSIWCEAFYQLSGRLLRTADGRQPARADLEQAFALGERLRGRVLLEALAAPTAGAAAEEPTASRVAGAIARLQLRLLDPRLGEEERREMLASLDVLEHREAAHRLGRPGTTIGEVHFAGLSEVEEALGPREAVLTFQVAVSQTLAGAPAGGSWLLVVTQQGTTVYPLPSAEELLPRLRAFLGLFDRRGRSPDLPAATVARLTEDLLAPALAGLPAQVDRLILIADGPLHHLPFALLRSAPEAPPLAERYRLTVAPSATLWLRWRQREPTRAPVPALILAAPERFQSAPGASGTSALAATRSAAFTAGADLGELPHARREGRTVRRRLGGAPSRLVTGPDATEHFMHTTDLARYRLLHFATHALSDDRHPHRSAVVLAPGEGHDGLLQPREIVGLDLADQIVVLSACESASGRARRGEGVMSLARAFFQAGARTVVGSLWRLGDRDAQALFERFYHHLADGSSVAAALQAAQRDRRRAGAPIEAWAGVVVLGDGNVVPLPGGVPRPPTRWLALGLLALLAVLLGLWRGVARLGHPRDRT